MSSHRAALRLWDLWSRFDGLEYSVRYPASRDVKGARVHRSRDLCEQDITVVDGIPVTTPARTLCDIGSVLGPSTVQRAVDHVVATGLVAKAELVEVRWRLGERGRDGIGALDAAIDALPCGAEETDSEGEVALLRLLAASGLPEPVRQHPVVIGTRTYHPDLSYPARKIVLEYDGVDPHTRIDRFVDDRRRQNDLIVAGWTVLRFTKDDIRDRAGAVAHQVRTLVDV